MKSAWITSVGSYSIDWNLWCKHLRGEFGFLFMFSGMNSWRNFLKFVFVLSAHEQKEALRERKPTQNFVIVTLKNYAKREAKIYIH